MIEWLRTPAYQALLAGVAVTFGALAATVPSDEPNSDPYRVLVFAAAVLMLARTPFLGVGVREDVVVLRSLISTRQVGADAITDVRVVNYDGILIPHGSWFWATLRVTTCAGREVVAYGLAGRRSVVSRRADRLRHLLGLAGPDPSPRHRADRTARGVERQDAG